MGYDFDIIHSYDAQNFKFPFDYNTDIKIDTILPKPLFERYVQKNGGSENGLNGWLIHYSDGSSLYLDYGDGAIGLDVHCHWKHILDFYQWILCEYPCAIIFDPQSGFYHNLDSFCKFVSENYQDNQ